MSKAAVAGTLDAVREYVRRGWRVVNSSLWKEGLRYSWLAGFCRSFTNCCQAPIKRPLPLMGIA